MAATVYFRMVRESADDLGESEWYILNYEKGLISRADRLMGSSTPPYRIGSRALAAGSEIYLFTSSIVKGISCDSYTSIDTSRPDPQWTTPSLIERPSLNPVLGYLDGKIYLFSKRVNRLHTDIWADLLDTSQKTWSIAKVPNPLPPDLLSEVLYGGWNDDKSEIYVLFPPVVGDPHNNRILIWYGHSRLWAYYPATNSVEEISDPQYKVIGWFGSHVVVDQVLFSSTTDVDCFQDSLYAHDLADGCCPMRVFWCYSPTCQGKDLFDYPQDTHWDAILDLGNGRLCLLMSKSMLVCTSEEHRVSKFIGGVIVEVHRGYAYDSESSYDQSPYNVVVWIMSTFLVPVDNPRGFNSCRDFLSTITPV